MELKPKELPVVSEIAMTLMLVTPTFWMEIVCEPLEDPIATLPKFKLAGEIDTCARAQGVMRKIRQKRSLICTFEITLKIILHCCPSGVKT